MTLTTRLSGIEYLNFAVASRGEMFSWNCFVDYICDGRRAVTRPAIRRRRYYSIDTTHLPRIYKLGANDAIRFVSLRRHHSVAWTTP